MTSKGKRKMNDDLNGHTFNGQKILISSHSQPPLSTFMTFNVTSLLFAILPSNINAWTASPKSRIKPTQTIMPTDDPSNLLPILSHAIPTIQSYSHLDNIVQGNAEGTRILARHSSSISEGEAALNENDTSDLEETELFLKRIDAKAYMHKSWTDMRRTLVYLRTEVRFYKEFVPLLCDGNDALSGMIPNCHHADYDLQGLVEDDSSATDVNAPPSVGVDKLQHGLEGKGGHILLQSLSPSHGYYQNSPISVQESLLCLRAVAELHASAWGNNSLLTQISDRLSSAGGSYHLRFRNPKELQNMVSSWEAFRNNFVGMDETKILAKESVVRLGMRVFAMAEYVSDQLSPSVDDEYATLVHGDYKAMVGLKMYSVETTLNYMTNYPHLPLKLQNVFLPATSNDECTSENSNTADEKAIMIDFSCVGIGYGMSDVAMHIVHAVLPADLENGQEEYLVEQYILALENAMTKKSKDMWKFPREVAQRQYQLACIDYLRFIMGRFWKSATPESFEKKKNSKNTTLINRDVKAAMAFIEKVDRNLEVFENEKMIS
ncbi:hypothetical protein ACHAWO_010506 [Cyclotella atomus]|uniref:Uncharacterized protein n=1 Tax=Cyclotella atomus TaxID=382360 RepID=A0ABD3Q8K1_9STRA